MMRPGIWIFLAGLTFTTASLCIAMPQPPDDAVTDHQGKTTYYSGTVYLTSHADTVKLKDLGFRDFAFEGRAFNSLKYKSRWPQSALNLPMPDYLTGIDYDVASNVEHVSDEVAPEDTTQDTTAVPSHPAHRYSMWMDTAAMHKFLAQLDVRVRAVDRLDHPRPDTVIADRKFTHGVVLMSSLADTAG
jgi:hypothetical protein